MWAKNSMKKGLGSSMDVKVYPENKYRNGKMCYDVFA